MLSDREEEKPLNMSEQPKRALKRSQASIRMKKINTPFHSFEEHVLMGKPREHVIAWSKSNPEEAGEVLDLLHCCSYSTLDCLPVAQSAAVRVSDAWP